MNIIKILIVLFATCSFGCGKTSFSPPKKPLILVSIAPYKFFVEKIGRDAIEVVPIAPLNADPHTFEPTARQVAEISRATLWFRIGEPFEKKIASTLKNKITIYNLYQDSDRHFWVSPKTLFQQAEAIQQALSNQFPEKSEEFKNNLNEFKKELEALDREILSILDPVQNRILLVSHPAFSSFCRDYEIEELSLEEEEKEIRPKSIEEIFQKARCAQFALALPQHNNKGIELIAKRLQLPLVTLNPYSEDYFAMIRTLSHYLAGDYE